MTGKPAHRAPDAKLAALFVPVLFANGSDDDTNGLIAAIDNRRVLLDDRIYEPGEPMRIRGRAILVNPKRLMLHHNPIDGQLTWISAEFVRSTPDRIFAPQGCRFVPIVKARDL